LTNNFSIIYQTRDFGSGQILPLEQLYLSPGFVKIAPYPPRHRDSFLAPLVRGIRMQTRWLRRVTFTTSTAGPLGNIQCQPLKQSLPNIKMIKE
jgi:hypothetical protein